MPIKCPHNQTGRCQMAFLWDGVCEWCMCTYWDPTIHTHHPPQSPIYFHSSSSFHRDTFDIFAYTLSHLPTFSLSLTYILKNTLTLRIEVGSCPGLREANIALERGRWEAARTNKAHQCFRKHSCKNIMLQSVPVHKKSEIKGKGYMYDFSTFSCPKKTKSSGNLFKVYLTFLLLNVNLL